MAVIDSTVRQRGCMIFLNMGAETQRRVRFPERGGNVASSSSSSCSSSGTLNYDVALVFNFSIVEYSCIMPGIIF